MLKDIFSLKSFEVCRYFCFSLNIFILDNKSILSTFLFPIVYAYLPSQPLARKCRHTRRPEEGVRPPGAVVIGNCQLFHVGAVNQS